jgi:hypothetical protein
MTRSPNIWSSAWTRCASGWRTWGTSTRRRALAAAAADLDVGGEDAALTLAAWTLWSRAEDFAAVGDEVLLS